MIGRRSFRVLPVLVLAGCANTDSPPPAPTAVPTAEEADARANRQIDESNADAEFEKLLNEIESGG